MREAKYSKTIAQAIDSFLKEDGWHFSFDEGVFTFGLGLRSKIKRIDYIVKVKADKFIVYGISPIGVDKDDKDMMARISEFIHRANYGLIRGNFEIDMNDGEIRYKVCTDCDGIEPSAEMIKNAIYCPGFMFDEYGSGITDIIFSNMSAKDAVEKCEGSFSDILRSLIGLSDQSGDAESEEPEIKTDLFGTEGDDN